jgi:hypothetical protein
MPVTPALGPMFVIRDEPTPTDYELAMNGDIRIVRLSDAQCFSVHADQAWEPFQSGLQVPGIAGLSVGKISFALDHANPIHVHPSVAMPTDALRKFVRGVARKPNLSSSAHE